MQTYLSPDKSKFMDIQQFVASNQFLSSGLLLLIFGAALAQLRQTPGKIWRFLKRQFVVTLDVRDDDQAYKWVQIWLANRLPNVKSLSVLTMRKSESFDENPITRSETEHKPRPSFKLIPDVGIYSFFYKGVFVTLSRQRHDQSTGNELTLNQKKGTFTRENFHITFWSRNQNLAKELVEECRDYALPDDGKSEVFFQAWDNWTLNKRVVMRGLNSVVLDHGKIELIRNDIKQFFANENKYAKLGVPWRRTYLFEGKPGNGKTSLAQALANSFGKAIAILALNDPELNDSRLRELMYSLPDRAFLLIEDIDCAFGDRETNNAQLNDKGPSFSGILNVLDGVTSQEGRVIFITTNYPERLDRALLRPGRIDMRIEFHNASRQQAYELFLRFFPEHTAEAEIFAAKIGDELKYNMATLQGHLLMHQNDPVAAATTEVRSAN